MPKTISIKTRANRYGREYTKDFLVSASDWPPTVSKWVWPSLEEMAKQSDLRRKHTTEWENLRWGIAILDELKAWPKFASAGINGVEPRQVTTLFTELEHYLITRYSEGQAYRISMFTRSMIRARLTALDPQGRYARALVSYKSSIKYSRRKGRGLISEVPGKGPNGPLHPVGALPHANAGELQSAMLTRLEADLERIAQCCVEELESYQAALERLRKLRGAPLPKRTEQALRKAALSATAGFPQERVDELLTLYLKIDSGERPRLDSAVSFPFATELKPHICDRLGIESIRFHSAIRIEAYPPMSVRVADLAANKDEADKCHVTIATPPHVNGSADWRFQRLKSIWLCEEPAVPQHAWIYETAQGDAYAHSLLGTRAAALKRIHPLYSDS